MHDPEWYQPAVVGGCDCITAIRSALNDAEFRGFCIGNVLKYLWRAGRKGPEDEDVRKAIDYLNEMRADDAAKK